MYAVLCKSLKFIIFYCKAHFLDKHNGRIQRLLTVNCVVNDYRCNIPNFPREVFSRNLPTTELKHFKWFFFGYRTLRVKILNEQSMENLGRCWLLKWKKNDFSFTREENLNKG